MIARGLSGAVLWGLFGLLLAVVLLAGSALSKRYAPKVGSGTLLVSAMSIMAGLASAVASLMSVLETGLSALVPLTVGPSFRRARSGRPTGWAWRPPSRRWPR